METDKFYDKFYYNYVVWKLEILCWKFYGLNRTMQYGNLKFYVGNFMIEILL